jgi:hypothetical protein
VKRCALGSSIRTNLLRSFATPTNEPPMDADSTLKELARVKADAQKKQGCRKQRSGVNLPVRKPIYSEQRETYSEQRKKRDELPNKRNKQKRGRTSCAGGAGKGQEQTRRCGSGSNGSRRAPKSQRKRRQKPTRFRRAVARLVRA